jgi:hypothetical protein
VRRGPDTKHRTSVAVETVPPFVSVVCHEPADESEVGAMRVLRFGRGRHQPGRTGLIARDDLVAPMNRGRLAHPIAARR